MEDGYSIDITALLELSAGFNSLAPILQSQIARGAAEAVATELRNRAAANAPAQAGPEGTEGGPPPGNLKKSLYRVRMPEKCTLVEERWKVNARMGNAKWKHKRNQGRETDGSAYYAGFVEFGHWTRTPSEILAAKGGTRNSRRKAFQATGQAKWVPANGYMRRALDSMAGGATNEIVAGYIKRNLPAALRALKYMKVGG